MNLLKRLFYQESIEDLLNYLDGYMLYHTSRFTHANYRMTHYTSGWHIIFTVNNMTYKTEDVSLRQALIHMRTILPQLPK